MKSCIIEYVLNNHLYNLLRMKKCIDAIPKLMIRYKFNYLDFNVKSNRKFIIS